VIAPAGSPIDMVAAPFESRSGVIAIEAFVVMLVIWSTGCQYESSQTGPDA
jgi:hypothetical protein